MSNNHTILVFGEIPVLQSHDSISSPLLLTILLNSFILFFSPRGSAFSMSQLDIVEAGNSLSLLRLTSFFCLPEPESKAPA